MTEKRFLIHDGTDNPDTIKVGHVENNEIVPCWKCGEDITTKNAVKSSDHRPYCSQECAVIDNL